jgi:hypothetical protein
MPNGPERGEPGSNPLEGVLDHLLARERGIRAGQARTRIERRPAFGRRMLVLAALGHDAGFEARATLARQALALGRRPAALDVACEQPPPADRARSDLAIPLASIPCGPERLRREPAEVVGALKQRLRRHEAAADLLIVRIPPSCRMALMRAAFLSGGLVVPLDHSHEVLHEALRLSREVTENFMELPVWPYSRDAGTLERYQSMMREFLTTEARPLEVDNDTLDDLNPSPEEGFLTAMLSTDSAKPPPRLLQLTSLHL